MLPKGKRQSTRTGDTRRACGNVGEGGGSDWATPVIYIYSRKTSIKTGLSQKKLEKVDKKRKEIKVRSKLK